MIFPWEPLKRCHSNTSLCTRGGGTEDTEYGRGVISIRGRDGLQNLWPAPVYDYALLLPMTELTVVDYDFTEVIGNLQKARQIWARLPMVMGQEVTDVRTLGHLYLAIENSVLVFGLETGVTTPHIGRVLGGSTTR